MAPYDDWNGAALRARAPRLELAFAAMGLVAGWIAGRVLSGPLFEGASSSEVPRVAAVCTGLFGLGAGVLLQVRLGQRIAPSMSERPWHKIPMPVIVVIWGAGAGVVVAWLRDTDGLQGAALGALSALPFVPLTWLVMRAAVAAARARQGSLVASNDRRGVWIMLLATTAASTLLALPEWSPPSYLRLMTPPIAAMAIAAAGWLAMLPLVAMDVRALRRLRAVARGSLALERADAATRARSGDAEQRADLGLGDEQWVTVRHGASYREGGRVARLVLGSPDDAMRALRRGLVCDVVAFAVVSLVLAAHVAMAAGEGRAPLAERAAQCLARW